MSEVQKKASDQGSVGLSFEYFWLRGCEEFTRPILKQDKTKPKQSRFKQEFLSSDNSINLQVSICLKMSFVFIDLLSRIISQIMEMHTYTNHVSLLYDEVSANCIY